VLFLGNLPMILDELRHPDSAPAFILTLLSTIGAVTAFTSGLGAFLRWSIQPIRTVAVAGAAVFVAGTVGSLAIASGVESDGAGPADVAVVAEQVAFAPVDLTMDAAESGVWVDNRDGIRHTFTIPELGVDLEIPALKAKRVDIDAAPGTYQIICTVPGHETMTGTLTVTG
jgi:plastocyanin